MCATIDLLYLIWYDSLVIFYLMSFIYLIDIFIWYDLLVIIFYLMFVAEEDLVRVETHFKIVYIVE